MALKFWKRSTFASPSAQDLESFGVTRSYAGESVTVDKAMGLTAVWNAVYQISMAVAQCPLKVFRVTDNDEREESKNHRSYRMLHDMPNEQTTAHTFWSSLTASLLLRGNAYIFKQRDELGMVEQLWMLDATQITVEVRSGGKVFIYGSGPSARTYTSEDVLHILDLSLNGGVTGCSRISFGRQSIGSAIGRDRFEGEFYAQGARIPGVIEHPGRLGKSGVENLAGAFRDKHTGKGNRHKVPVLEEGAHFQQIGMSLEDMQFVESKRLSQIDIANLFNIPASRLNTSAGDSLTYSTQELNDIQFAKQTVAPITTNIASALTNDPAILPWNVMYAEFVLEGLMRADAKTRAEVWSQYHAMGVVDEQYIAARENLPKPKPKPVMPAIEDQQQLPLPPALKAVNQ
jgi:HK97 family phage portal protein